MAAELYRTKEAATVNFRTHGDIIVPSGTLVAKDTWEPEGIVYIVDQYEWITDPAIKADAVKFGILVPESAVDLG